MTVLMRTTVTLVSLVMCWGDAIEGQQNAYCESFCALSPACANATHGTYCTYWAETPLCYGLFSLGADLCYHPDADCLDYDPIPCDASSISNTTTATYNHTMPSPPCQFTVLCVDGNLTENCTLESAPSPYCSCPGLNFTCGNGSDLCPELKVNLKEAINSTACNETDCLASCVSISNSSVNGTQYVCNCSMGNSSYSHINASDTTTAPVVTTSAAANSTGTASPTPTAVTSISSSTAVPTRTASSSTSTAIPTASPVISSSSPLELPYGSYCGLLGDDLPLVFTFSDESVDISGGEVFSLVGIGFFGFDPNSPAGKTVDINLSDPQFATITGPNGSLDRQFLTLSYYSSTDSLGGFFTGRPVELSPTNC